MGTLEFYSRILILSDQQILTHLFQGLESRLMFWRRESNVLSAGGCLKKNHYHASPPSLYPHGWSPKPPS